MEKIHGRHYLKIDLIELNQKGKLFYVGKIKASEMLSVYTVRPAKYDIEKNSSIAQSFPNEKDYYEFLTSEIESNFDEKDFQRKYSESRVNEIQKFLTNQEYAFFPNTIITYCDLLNDLENFDIGENAGIEYFKSLSNVPSQLSYFYRESGNPILLIPFEQNSLLVIDGQHRLEGLKKVDPAIQNEYDLLVAFIIGYDRSVIAQQFYTINYEQKPVNKSLLYHLMGEFSNNLDELTFVHKVVKALNELEQSPFHKRIKMLGTAPSNYEDKKSLSVSLAFLIDALLRTLSSKSTPGIYQPIFRYYFNHEEYQIDIIRGLMNYFKAISNLVQNWDDPNSSLISKGMGIGAAIKVLQLLFPIVFVNDWKLQPSKFKNLEVKYFESLLSGIQNVDFSKEGKFGGVGSAGSINKIKEEIIINLNYLESDTYLEFESFFKSEILPEYKLWLKQNL